ncbi:MAG: hypothetical protein JWO80_1310 [Bryobacterales bacterium]|nr:hypothetical protein [Bryobacterales bacterium]
MNPLLGLTEYLRKLERNLRFLAVTRGAAIIGGAALLVTVVLVVVANHFSFSGPSVFWSRVLLFLAIAAVLTAGLIVPLVRLNRRWTARRAEERFPEFQQRLLTFTEKSKQNASDPFLPLLAADALEVANRRSEPIVPRSWIVSFGSAAAVAITVLLWLGASGPGFLGYGTALLWGGYPKADRRPLYTIHVSPGTHRIRRRSDQVISATLNGFTSSKVSVMAKYASSTKWEEAPMQPLSHSAGYTFVLAGVPEDVEYYVEAGGVHSDSYKLTVVDLPAVKKIKVTYHYPSWLGLKSETEDPGGDLRAVEGTEAEIEITTDKPLAEGSLVLDSGKKIELASKDGKLVARVPIEKDDMYHVATPDAGEMVRLTENYFIEARKDSPPTVSILKPGRDAKVSPIEEVAVSVQGKDDFALQGLELHYSVNGLPEKTVSMANAKGRKEADGSTTLFLEDYKLVPGDVVSLYATARDARNTAKTDIFFIEAQPFEKEYSQSQQAGGGGGGGDEEQNNISKREKELISATWNQLKGHEKGSAAENAKYLADVQAKLRDQAQSLANRMKARQMTDNNPAFKAFTEDMEKAVASMGPASDQLRGQKFQDALTPEQKALQYLLRAESTFRQIQVAFGRQGGGGGGSQGASRDLENMFDLELDTEKNQYEAGQQSSADQKQKEVDDALNKLEQLARRQQELAQQAKNGNQSYQQRWEQEMLRREAEELRRQMEQLTRNDSSQQQQQGQQGQQSQSQSGQQGKQGQQGSQQGQQQAQSGQQGGQQGQQSMRRTPQQQAQQRQLEQALRSLTEATRDMGASASARQGAQSQNQSAADRAKAEADARSAADRLKEARDMLSSIRKQETGSQLDNLNREADKLASQQEDFASRLRKNFGSGEGNDPSGKQGIASQMSQEKQQESEALARLQQEMQKAARDLAQSQPEVSRKLRDALGEMQQMDLQTSMNWSAEAIRRGMGAYAVMREAPVTQALNQTREQIRQAQEAFDKNKGGAAGGDQKMQDALAQAERLRQEIEQIARAGKNGQQQQQPNGQHPGQQSARGQQQGNQPGNQPGGQQQSGQQQGNQQGGQQGGQQPGQDQQGSYSPNGGGGPTWGGGGRTAEGAYSDAMRDIARLQQAVRDNPDLSRQLRDLSGTLRGVNVRAYANNPDLLDKVIGQVLGSAEQIELELRRKVEAGNSSPHAATPQPVPPGYANAVAEYYRRLSKQ